MDHRDFALVHTAAYSGARQSELLGLEKDCILWGKSSIYIKRALHIDLEAEDGYEHRDSTKNDTSERTVKMSKIAMDIIARHLVLQEQRGIESDLVFTEPDGQPINRNNLAKRYANLARKRGFPGMTFHHLRHTHITILLSNGAYINQVAERSGHADPSTTLRVYGHCLPKGDDLLVSTFNNLIDPPPKNDGK